MGVILKNFKIQITFKNIFTKSVLPNLNHYMVSRFRQYYLQIIFATWYGLYSKHNN